MARCLRPASASDPGTWNKYSYVGGDPANRVDPDGTDYEGLDDSTVYSVCLAQGTCDNGPALMLELIGDPSSGCYADPQGCYAVLSVLMAEGQTCTGSTGNAFAPGGTSGNYTATGPCDPTAPTQIDPSCSDYINGIPAMAAAVQSYTPVIERALNENSYGFGIGTSTATQGHPPSACGPTISWNCLYMEDYYIVSALVNRTTTPGYSYVGGLNAQANFEAWSQGPTIFNNAMNESYTSADCQDLIQAVNATIAAISNPAPGVLNWRGKGVPFHKEWNFVIQEDFTTFYGFINYLPSQ